MLMEHPAPPESLSGLSWRLPAWFATAVALCIAVGYVANRLVTNGPPFGWYFVISTVLIMAVAWALGLFDERVSKRALFVVASAMIPVFVFLVALAVAIYQMQAAVQPPPPIAQGQHFGLQGMPLADHAWTKSLDHAFPPGSRETALVAALRAQGFRIDAAKRQATFDYQVNAICREYLWIEWAPAPDGRIASVAGTAGGMCP